MTEHTFYSYSHGGSHANDPMSFHVSEANPVDAILTYAKSTGAQVTEYAGIAITLEYDHTRVDIAYAPMDCGLTQVGLVATRRHLFRGRSTVKNLVAHCGWTIN
jgi:hypothetical protein